MIFPRRRDVTLTQMAQWVDQYGTQPDCDKNILIEYLFHLVYNKAQKLSLCKDAETFDDFSLFCVTKLTTRLNNKQEQPVKSIVNYIRTVITLWYAEYIRDFCCGSADLPIADFDVCDFSDYLIDATSEFDYNVYGFYTLKVSDVARKHLSKIPKKRNSAEWSNIYTSCLLTLNNRIKTATILFAAYDEATPYKLGKILRDLKKQPPILYHLDDTMAGYVSVLVNEIVHAVSTELSYTTVSKVSPSACLKNLVIAANNDEDN